MAKSKPDAEEHGEALVDVSFGYRARIQSGLSIVTDVATTIHISTSVQNVGHALLLGVIEIVMRANDVGVSIAVTGNVPVPTN